jgi:hypothetical protein
MALTNKARLVLWVGMRKGIAVLIADRTRLYHGKRNLLGGWSCGSSILSEGVSLLQLPWWVCVSFEDDPDGKDVDVL